MEASVAASGSCRYRTCHRLQAFYRWVRTSTPSGFGFRQYSFTHRRRVIRSPCSTTLSSMRRLPGMLGYLQLSPPAMPVTQEPLLSSSCLQQGYHNAPHGAHRTGVFRHIRLSSSTRLLGSCKLMDNHPFQSAPVEAQHNLLRKVPHYAGEQGPTTHSAFRFRQSTSIGCFPGSPSSCPRHYSTAFDYYAASALYPARWHFSRPCRVEQF